MIATLELRWFPVAVARLGDADLHGWWRSHGMDATGEYVLSDLFPRTWQSAGAEIAVLSAAKRHADALGSRSDVLHLFGEPFPAFRQAMAWLAELKTQGDDGSIEAIRGWTASTACTELETILGDVPSGEQIGGTLRLGTLNADTLADPKAVLNAGRALAAAYVRQGNELHVPYFDLA